MDTNHQTTRLFTVSQWPHEWPSKGGLRHMIFNQKTNGFDSAFKRVGRRVLVDEAEFFRCVERVNEGRGQPGRRRRKR